MHKRWQNLIQTFQICGECVLSFPLSFLFFISFMFLGLSILVSNLMVTITSWIPWIILNFFGTYNVLEISLFLSLIQKFFLNFNFLEKFIQHYQLIQFITKPWKLAFSEYWNWKFSLIFFFDSIDTVWNEFSDSVKCC